MTSTNITLGDAPLTVTNDSASQYDYTFGKSSNQNYSSKEPFPKNSLPIMEQIYVPGYAHQVTSLDQQCHLPSMKCSYTENVETNLTLNTLFHIQLSAYPDPPTDFHHHQFSDSELPYDVPITSIQNEQLMVIPKTEHLQ